MPRRPRCKRIAEIPGVRYFEPRAVPMAELEEVVLTLEELESLRLAHLESKPEDSRGTSTSR
jgi:predicted DNA-binding protein (UPF0251 family)